MNGNASQSIITDDGMLFVVKGVFRIKFGGTYGKIAIIGNRDSDWKIIQ